MKSTPHTLRKCRVCKEKTGTVINIDYQAIPVCDFCCNAIFIQQARWLAEKERDQIVFKLKGGQK
jgi:hypothetical protein